VIVEDPVQGKHYRLGSAEYQFLTHLAHAGSIASAHQKVSQASPEWSPNTSSQMLGWLLERRLIEDCTAAPAPLSPRKPRQRLSADPLFFRVTFGSAEGWSARLANWLKPLLVRYTAWFFVLVVAVAVAGLLARWGEFSNTYSTLLTSWGVATLAIVSLVLKVLHEVGHCVTCHVLGGRARECGVVFIGGIPLPFVDVSDSRRFPSRAARIAVALAGVVVECLATAAVVVFALLSGTPLAYYVAAHLVLTFGLATLLFNLNPLMKFDGYYVLIELLGVDNLYGAGAAYLGAVGRRLFLGREAGRMPPTPLLTKVYGIASFTWRSMSIVAIGCLVIWVLHGVGLVLVAWTAWRIWGQPAVRAYRQTATGHAGLSGVRSSSHRLARVLGAVAALLAAACLLPWPVKTATHAIVEYDPPATIRAPADAFVEAVHVTDNQHVEQGELLVTLRNDELAERLTTLDYACGYHQLRIRTARSRQEMRELKDARSALDAALEQRRQTASKAALLEVRAPIAGVVSARNLEDLLGVYLTEGTEIAAVGREDAKRLRVLAPPESVGLFARGEQISYLTASGRAGDAVVEDVLPRATRLAGKSPLGAHLGGPLDVVTDDEREVRFSTAFTPVIARLDPRRSLEARVGQRVTVSTGARKKLAQWLWDRLGPGD
jgi:putative peptide zinc metalloprotease protein